MTARSRLLSAGTDDEHSPPLSFSLPTRSKNETTSNVEFVVVLASLLFGLVCFLGFVAVARCTWIRHFSAGRHAAGLPVAAANRGVKKKVLNTLPKITYGIEDSGGEQATETIKNLSDCAICLAEFAPGEEIRVLPQCDHGFHIMCIDSWLRSHSSCPSCRQILGAAQCQKLDGLPAARSIPASASVNELLPARPVVATGEIQPARMSHSSPQ